MEQAAVQTREKMTRQWKNRGLNDIAMDQRPKDASMTRMRMDGMLMDQVMAVSCGTSRVCVNEEKYEPATIRGLQADFVKKSQAREMKKESTVPKDAKILECGWAMKMKSPSEVRARVVLKDYAVTKLDDVCAPTPTSTTVRFLLFYAAWQHFRRESSTHTCHCFGTQVCSRMAVADQESDERNENSAERFRIPGCRRDERNPSSEEKQTHRSTKTQNPKQQSYSTLTTQSWHHDINRQLKRGNASWNTCC